MSLEKGHEFGTGAGTLSNLHCPPPNKYITERDQFRVQNQTGSGLQPVLSGTRLGKLWALDHLAGHLRAILNVLPYSMAWGGALLMRGWEMRMLCPFRHAVWALLTAPCLSVPL